MATPLKDQLAAKEVALIAQNLSDVYPRFDSDHFQSRCQLGLAGMELKQRVQHIIKCLHLSLPASYPETAAILSKLAHHWKQCSNSETWGAFTAWPLIDYVGKHGVQHPETSLPLLRELTSLFTAEFAIRPFIITHESLCEDYFKAWVNDSNPHVRRLVSEGTRPRLPWGIQLRDRIRDPRPALHLLEALRDDPSDYVRRSVANHLNDISKDHPYVVIEICRSWLPEATPNRLWIIRHATRTLIKQGHPDVFPLLGFTPAPALRNITFHLSPSELKLGSKLQLSAEISSSALHEQKLAIDFAIHFVKANQQTSPKVFKWKEVVLLTNSTIQLSKAVPIKKISTRRHYSGVHQVDLIINGKKIDSQLFNLTL